MSEFREALVRALIDAGLPAEIVLTDNRSTLVSVVPKHPPMLRGGRPITMELRVSRHLAELGADAALVVAGFATGRPGADVELQALIRAVPSDAVPSRRMSLDARGEVHDLGAIAERVRAEWFPEAPPARVGWGRRKGRRGTRMASIRLGTYESKSQVIRLHPRLDDARVPAWFVEFIVFHEYLHHVLGVSAKGESTRRAMHTREFNQRERAHPDYARALAWEAEHLDEILSASW
ncbi:MAG: hypothetical protein U1F43_37000 [Myxococcota bacterium]